MVTKSDRRLESKLKHLACTAYAPIACLLPYGMSTCLVICKGARVHSCLCDYF